MHAKLLGLSLITGLMSATAFAEPAIQPGDSLESLSKVKVTTTVNGQAGSIQDLVASGQIRIIDASQAISEPTQAGAETNVQNHSASDSTTHMDTPAVEQTNTPAIEQTAQVTSEEPIQPNAELAIQQAEQVLNQEVAVQPSTNNNNDSIAAAPMVSSSADTPVNAADSAQIDVTHEAVNAAETMTTNEVAATPEATQPTDAVQAAPEADLTDTPLNASPEAPIAETTEN
ncbi:hypothetical protein B9T25_02315 [Acinetobacter sp. ANC 4470]|nr:hypothetical protein [Acinetobacter sp. ANC 4470]OTG69432.1 hypothetical protein B9T25_02315 [Acinetobacter sp. ANC 4470]